MREIMKEPDIDTLLFFDKHPDVLPLYLRFEEALRSVSPHLEKRVQKTQITFSNRHVFACVSFAKVRKKAALPDSYIVITLGLPYPLESERVAVKTEPYPGRWTTHIVVGSIDEINAELLTWVKQAYDFAESK
jgi:hypothetical protein